MFEKLKRWYRWNFGPKPQGPIRYSADPSHEPTQEELDRFYLEHSAYYAKGAARNALLGDYQRTPEHGPVYINSHGSKYGKRPFFFVPDDKDYVTFDHQERFDTLSDFVENLVDYLTEHFDVSVTAFDATEPECSWVPEPKASVVYRLVPHDPGANTVWIAVRTDPSVCVSVKETGANEGSTSHPYCGCDACDESYESSAESIEDEVFNQIMGEPGGAHSWQRIGPIDNVRPHSSSR